MVYQIQRMPATVAMRPYKDQSKLKHGLMWATHALIGSMKHTEGHAFNLAYLKFVTIATCDPPQLWW